jgi:hypothetical protein
MGRAHSAAGLDRKQGDGHSMLPSNKHLPRGELAHPHREAQYGGCAPGLRSRKRKTMEDTRRRSSQEAGIARWKEWKSFQHGASRVSSWVEARSLGSQGPKTGTPGSSFYTNLLYFARYDSVPLGADGAQVAIYEALVTRLGRPPRDVVPSS